MKRLYQRMFDQVHMPEEQAQALRETLASRCSEMEKETFIMKEQKVFHRPVVVLMALLLVSAFSITAFAYGGRIVESIYQFMSGGIVEQGVDENGTTYSSGALDLAQVTSPVEIREDGRLYLIANGENIDITDQCSYTTPYIFECTGEDGLRHVFVIGGNLDAIGWSEFIWDETGLPAGGSSVFGTSGGREDAPWLDAALDTLGLPW